MWRRWNIWTGEKNLVLQIPLAPVPALGARRRLISADGKVLASLLLLCCCALLALAQRAGRTCPCVL